jgi:hypothetical protein
VPARDHRLRSPSTKSELARFAAGPSKPAKRLRLKLHFVRDFNLIWAVQPTVQKYLCLRKSEYVGFIAPSRAHEEGRTRRHERGAQDAMDAGDVD